MTDDLKVNVTDEQISEINDRYTEALKIEDYLKRKIYIEKFNKDNFHILRSFPIFSNHKFDETQSVLYKV